MPGPLVASSHTHYYNVNIYAITIHYAITYSLPIYCIFIDIFIDIGKNS